MRIQKTSRPDGNESIPLGKLRSNSLLIKICQDKVASDRPKKFSSVYESNHVTTDSCKPICVSHQPLIKLNGKINNISATFLVDCGSSGNFISSSFIEKHKLDVSDLEEVQSVTLADGTVQSSSKVYSQM